MPNRERYSHIPPIEYGVSQAQSKSIPSSCGPSFVKKKCLKPNFQICDREQKMCERIILKRQSET